MTQTKKQSERRLADMNGHTSDPAIPQAALASPTKRAIEQIKKQVGVLEHFLHEQDLKQAEEDRFADLQQQYMEQVQKNERLAQSNSDLGQWLVMIRTALKSHDDGELSARQFANEVDAAIKGWEGK
jgi:hypothetical protein